MITVNIDLTGEGAASADRSYPVMIGTRLLAQTADYIKAQGLNNPASLFLITDKRVAKLWLKPVEQSLEQAWPGRVTTIILQGGEGSKSFQRLASLCETILAKRPERKSLLVALGGGIIGDLVGFTASILLRGIDFIQIPTSLLAQVDSSVGGKTGINSAYGKNLIGSFHQPRLVISDLDCLTSLVQRQRKAGYAEIVKYAAINDRAFFDWLTTNGKAVIAAKSDELSQAIATSCLAKATIVASDERESGMRALLNFGHSFGHALENVNHYRPSLLHGEAVSIGMCLAFRLSVARGLCAQGEATRFIQHLSALGLPTHPHHRPLNNRKGGPEKWKAEDLTAAMTQDKKMADGRLTLILTRGIGACFLDRSVGFEELQAFWQSILAEEPSQSFTHLIPS